MDPRIETSRTNRFVILEKEYMDDVCVAILSYLREGRTNEMFLADYSLSKTKWDKFIRKNKKVGECIADGLVYYTSFWQKKAVEWARDKDRSQAVSKMLLENVLGWTASRDSSLGIDIVLPGSTGGYRVIIEKESASMEPPKEIVG